MEWRYFGVLNYLSVLQIAVCWISYFFKERFRIDKNYINTVKKDVVQLNNFLNVPCEGELDKLKTQLKQLVNTPDKSIEQKRFGAAKQFLECSIDEGELDNHKF